MAIVKKINGATYVIEIVFQSTEKAIMLNLNTEKVCIIPCVLKQTSIKCIIWNINSNTNIVFVQYSGSQTRNRTSVNSDQNSLIQIGFHGIDQRVFNKTTSLPQTTEGHQSQFQRRQPH
jgi:hypothetical protein